MRNYKKLLVAALLFVAGASTAMAQQMPAIPTDPDVKIGKLDNGLTYYIRHNAWPEQRAEFYIAQRVGSIQENDDQRLTSWNTCASTAQRTSRETTS